MEENTHSKYSDTFHSKVHVTDALDDPKEADKILREVEVDNESASWSCQEWVLSALEALKDEELIPDYDYGEAVANLAPLAGDNDESD